MIYYDKSGRRLYRPVRREEANEEANEVAERRSIVGTLIFLAVLAATVLIAISYLSGCTVGTHSGPAVQQQAALPTALPPGQWVTGPQGYRPPGGPVGAYVICGQAGAMWGPIYYVRVSDQAHESLAKEKVPVPCPPGRIIDWKPASTITSVDGMRSTEPYVTCQNVSGPIDVAPDNKTAVYHVGDQCPNGTLIS